MNSLNKIVQDNARFYHRDLWENQDNRVEVWIEKDALVSVIAPICERLDVAYFSCRGYTSQSAMWEAGERLLKYRDYGQAVVVLHLGDHDPSGIDMSRDIQDRLDMFMDGGPEFLRVALNADQVQQYNPPPNPAKITDSRAESYIRIYGRQSWELDALEPRVISDLIDTHVAEFRDEAVWADAEAEQEKEREQLTAVYSRWAEVAALVS